MLSKKLKNVSLFVVISLLLGLGGNFSLYAKKTAKKTTCKSLKPSVLIKMLDDTIGAPDTQIIKAKTILYVPKNKDWEVQEKRTLLIMRQKQEGKDDKIFMRFLAPQSVKDVSFLSLTSDRMYLYLPSTSKIRRISSSAKNDNFMGTDMSYNDISITKYSNYYTAQDLKGKDAPVIGVYNKSFGYCEYTVNFIPKKGSDISYSKATVSLVLLDSNHVLARCVKYYNKVGKKEYLVKKISLPNKSAILKKIVNNKTFWLVGEMNIISFNSDGSFYHRTQMQQGQVEVNSKIVKSKYFKKRFLKRSLPRSIKEFIKKN